MDLCTNLWRVISSNNFIITVEMPQNIFCFLCKKLMVNPYITDCGCQFCFECVKDYLNNANDHCPGGKVKCKELTLEIDKTIRSDFATFHVIKHVTVKCPHELCPYEIELKDFEEHLRICEKSKSCPYQVFGCSKYECINDPIKKHLQENILIHSKLLLETINYHKTDLSQLIQVNQRREKTFSKLNDENQNCKNVIDDLRIEIDEIKEEVKEIENNVAAEYRVLEKKNVSHNYILKGAFSKKKVECISNNNSNIGEIKNQIKNLNLEINKINNVMIQLKLLHDFIWIVDNFSKRKWQYYESGTFSKDNYKACLRVWIGAFNIKVHLWILEGENDHLIEWPIKHTVLLNIINQDTLRVYASETYNFKLCSPTDNAFSRPFRTKNNHIGSLNVLRSDIIEVDGLLKADSIMISCSLIRITN